jgi:hypothetical protein
MIVITMDSSRGSMVAAGTPRHRGRCVLLMVLVGHCLGLDRDPLQSRQVHTQILVG